MKQERLFEAIGGADPSLVMRSEGGRGRRVRPVQVLAALAACFAVILGVTLSLRLMPGVPAAGEQNGAPSGEGAGPAENPNATGSSGVPQVSEGPELVLEGGEVGRLHVLRQDTAAPSFLINVNPEVYTAAEKDGTYWIRPVSAPVGEEFPPVEFTITHLDALPAEAAEAAAASLGETYAQVSEREETERGFSIRAGDGDAWNAAQAQAEFVSDGGGGTFLLYWRYFTEAEEGHGAAFRAMANTFQAIPAGTRLPEWMESLYAVTDQVMAALFSNRPEELAGILDREHDFVEGHGEDVSGYVTVAAIDYSVDDETAPTAAMVSVRHSINWEEGYDFLTMELRYSEGRWLLKWAGIEK